MHTNLDIQYFIQLKRTNPLSLTKYENEAQIFAAEFLLDDDILEKYPDKTIFDIAREEYVSVELVKLKIANLQKHNNFYEFNNLKESNFADYYTI